MKALILTNEYPPNVYGGAGVHVEYLARELAKIIEVEVRCFGKQNKRAKNLKAKGFLFSSAIYKNCPDKIQASLQALERGLRFNAEKVEAQIVHCHTWYSMFGGILAKILYGLPLVITTHSLEPLRPWKREQLGTGYDISSWIEKTAVHMADKIIAVSQETKKDILRCYAISDKKVTIIPNGIDTKEYRKVKTVGRIKKYGLNPNKPYVLFVGRITRQKGIIHLVNAIKYIAPEIQVVLCAGAPDTKEIQIEMERGVAEAKKNRKNIFWIREMVPKKTAIELYSQAAVFCCPSIYEPFGIINLEAMACSIPVVASKVGGIKEVVKHNETGLLINLRQENKSPFEALEPDKFARDLAQGINSIVTDEVKRKKMGEKGRQRAEQVFSWEAVAEKVVDLYRLLVENKS